MSTYPGKKVTISDNSGGLAKSIEYYLPGWSTSADGSGAFYAPGATLTPGLMDVTLYAVWRKIEGLLSPVWSTMGVSNCADQNGNVSANYYLFNGTPITSASYRFSSDQSFTISVWFNTSFDPVSPGDDTKYPKIFIQASPGCFEYFLYLNKGKLGAWIWHNGYSSSDYHYGDCAVSANTWHHAVMVYDGASTKLLQLYLNAILQGEETYTKDYAAAPTSDSEFGSTDNWTYTGMIGGIHIYDRALCAAEVEALYYE